jgi:Arc/MetJ family transcription regulator
VTSVTSAARLRFVVEHHRVGFLPVYRGCMSRTNIDIDEEACQAVMDRYHLSTKRAAVNFALRTLAAEPLDLDSARRLRGSGWDGDLGEMRTSRTG